MKRKIDFREKKGSYTKKVLSAYESVSERRIAKQSDVGSPRVVVSVCAGVGDAVSSGPPR